MELFVPEDLVLEEIAESDLVRDWTAFDKMPYTQALGDQWIFEATSAILKIPSVVVNGDSNYLLNPGHDDYKKIKLLRSEPFEFDNRIKGN